MRLEMHLMLHARPRNKKGGICTMSRGLVKRSIQYTVQSPSPWCSPGLQRSQCTENASTK